MMEAAAYWLGFACFTALACCLFLLPLLAIFRRTRPAAGYSYVACSFLFGASLWIMCFFTVWDYWGLGAALIGVLVLGVGVLPMALVALAWASHWPLVAEIIGLGVVTFGVRMLGMWLADRAP